MIWVLSFALAACVLATAAASAQAPANTPPPLSVKVGQIAPDFTATYLAAPDANGRRQGKPVTLSEFKGQKHVVLAFFPAAFSPGCTSDMAKYQETSGQFNSNNTVILGMSVDSPWANAAFGDKLGARFNILSDARREISRASARRSPAERSAPPASSPSGWWGEADGRGRDAGPDEPAPAPG
jgi:peroxiredoxin